jgi:hypothetical protein
MKEIKCIDNYRASLTLNKLYKILNQDRGYYKIEDDDLKEIWYCKKRFEEKEKIYELWS